MCYKDGMELIHPGEVLKEQFLDKHGITQVELAEHLGISFQRVNEIINGRRGITPETAHLLAQAFRTNPDFWLAMQLRYDMDAFTAENKVRQVKPMI